MAAGNLRQTILKKKVKSTKSLFFKMARDGKWLRVAADGCNQLQALAATYLPKQPLAATWAWGCQAQSKVVVLLFAF